MNAERLPRKLYTARVLAATGMLRPTRPDRLVAVLRALRRYGPTPAAGYIASAARFPDAVAVHDERGSVTFAELHHRSNALARGLRDAGVGPGDNVAIMCRNHRWFVDAVVACSKLGANGLFLNTMFAAPQVTDVCAREQPVALIFDQEFEELVGDAAEGRRCFVAWRDDDGEAAPSALDDLIGSGDSADLDPPPEPGRIVILTSGTTGTPKGAARKQPDTIAPAAALFSKIPLKARGATMIAAPMFHSWGFAHFTLGMALSSTLVLRRRFDPEGTLAATAEHHCTALAVIPVMLQRILALPPETIARYDLTALRVIAASGSALPGELALRVMDTFGDVLYNLYGSTEVAWATIATPAELRAAPGTAGTPPRGTIVRLYDEQARPVGRGETGRIFVGNEMLFEGYTGGGSKEVIDGLMATGDVGHFDEHGRLFVSGRDDEMIVSGGENVFPREVEDLLSDHPAVEEAAVIGIEDPEFGQRLKAFVVKRPGQDVGVEDLRAHVKATLAAYKVPKEVVFLDELPRNATGKILKRELRQLA